MSASGREGRTGAGSSPPKITKLQGIRVISRNDEKRREEEGNERERERGNTARRNKFRKVSPSVLCRVSLGTAGARDTAPLLLMDTETNSFPGRFRFIPYCAGPSGFGLSSGSGSSFSRTLQLDAGEPEVDPEGDGLVGVREQGTWGEGEEHAIGCS